MRKVIFMAAEVEAAAALAEHAFTCISKEPFQVWENASRLLVITGIGPVNASCAFSWAASKFRFDTAFNIGTAGATAAVRCLAVKPAPENLSTGCGSFHLNPAGIYVPRPSKKPETLEKFPEKPECGTCREKRTVYLGGIYNIGTVSSLDPYNAESFSLTGGKGAQRGTSLTLATCSHSVETSAERGRAAQFAELADMECYALAHQAFLVGKKFAAFKLVSDFSHKCDVHKNICALSSGLAKRKYFWED